ncbi:hypothetical protein [Marisediminicola senii]|uniref:hypothetical protein n=1 Tax=Marisediminicola senii TaxID=2711233 RepID=UPI0013EC15C0|nr:hypothetical protein [Marisediminicola senii]
MDAYLFRERVLEAAGRVRDRTGVDPLDVDESMAVTTDARLEILPGSIGLGLAAMGTAAGIACIGFLLAPQTGPGEFATWVLILVAVLLVLGSVACVGVARTAKARRPEHRRYEDAWAKLSTEVWPRARYQSWDGGPGTGASYSRTEFLIALRDDRPLDEFIRHAPFTRMP